MGQSGYYKKYVILEELDSGFGIQSPPEGFVRLESNREGIMFSLQIKHLRKGALPYIIIIVYGKENKTEVFRVGSFDVSSGTGVFGRTLDYSSLETVGLNPEDIKYIIVASEHRDRVFIPLAGVCSKTIPWDETVRQKLLKKEKVKEPESIKGRASVTERKERTEADYKENLENRVDDECLERKLKETFEQIEPFSNPRDDYTWYRVNDIAKLSNLLFTCNMKIPLFANPRILVGLFKYRHILAGFYRSFHNNMNYFVLGVPAKDETDGKPFENISRWVGSVIEEYGDMTGYWLVYINMRTGEFVR